MMEGGGGGRVDNRRWRVMYQHVCEPTWMGRSLPGITDTGMGVWGYRCMGVGQSLQLTQLMNVPQIQPESIQCTLLLVSMESKTCS